MSLTFNKNGKYSNKRKDTISQKKIGIYAYKQLKFHNQYINI